MIQVLFSLKSFREHIHQLNTIDPIVLTIKNLFNQIECSNTSIETYLYVQSLELPHYQPGVQFDAHECLLHILNLIYPPRPDNSVPDESVFQISSLESILCQTCNNASENTLLDTICPISFPDPYRMNSIQIEIERLTNDPHGELVQSYPCVNCPTRTNATKARTVLNISDFIIFQLKLYHYDLTTATAHKLVPNLQIELEIENILLGTLTLHAIVYHHGNTPRSGHYTSAVKYNNTWFLVDDQRISNVVRFTCTMDDYMVPYLLIYKKKTGAVVIPNDNIVCDLLPEISSPDITESFNLVSPGLTLPMFFIK